MREVEEMTPLAAAPMTKQQALTANALIPFSPTMLQPGINLHLMAQGANFGLALDCLTAAIYYEAGSEPVNGQRAVAQVVINRVAHPAFPSTVCGVVFQGSKLPTGCQFSFTCDGSLRRRPQFAGWMEARRIAQEALGGATYPAVGLSTHYHADYVVPYWAHTLLKHAVIGHHIFYGWPGRLGLKSAFSQHYQSKEQPPAIWKGQDQQAMADTAPTIALDETVFTRESLRQNLGPSDGVLPPPAIREAGKPPSSRYVISMEQPAPVQVSMVMP